MAGAITLTPEELKRQSQTYVRASQSIQQAIRSVESTNNEIQSQWQGQAFQAYLQQFDQLKGNVKQMEELLESIHQQLNKYADTVAERDRQDASSFGLN